MSPLTLPPAAAAYLAELERELADIPAEERVDLLEEVEASLLEGGDEPVARLGTPTRFAAELRASAGLPPAPSVPPPRRPSAWARFKKDSRVRAAGSVARELAPIWWVARAAVLVALLGLGVQSRYAGLLPRLTGHLSLDIAIVALVPIASVALGLAGRRRPLPVRGVRIAADLALAACLVFVPGLVDELRGRVDGVVYVQSTPPPPAGLANNGVSLRNVYPYDRKGRLLHDVRLYDQDGKPLNLGRGAIDPNRRSVATRAGDTVFNAFPIRYFDPGTQRVARPNAVPEGLKPTPLR